MDIPEKYVEIEDVGGAGDREMAGWGGGFSAEHRRVCFKRRECCGEQ